MTVTDLIAEKIKNLPPEKQREVLDFIEFLHGRVTERRPRRSLWGLWADLGVDITTQDIDEARQEMWGSFPREAA
jgi:hypothetical protein